MVVLLKLREKKFDTRGVNNGILAGLVAVTAGAPLVTPEGAFVIGVVAAVVYYASANLLLKLQIDDVVDAVRVCVCVFFLVGVGRLVWFLVLGFLVLGSGFLGSGFLGSWFLGSGFLGFLVSWFWVRFSIVGSRKSRCFCCCCCRGGGGGGGCSAAACCGLSRAFHRQRALQY